MADEQKFTIEAYEILTKLLDALLDAVNAGYDGYREAVNKCRMGIADLRV
ncbi:hypothetical protein KAR91_35025 [Candidatus Pacearchaeota archaeon]|nr:hypothetical protein [Candidatus Pacearchaeota archaeon]